MTTTSRLLTSDGDETVLRKLGYLHSHTLISTSFSCGPGRPMKSWSTYEVSIHLPPKITVRKLEVDQIHLVPRFSKVGGYGPHESHSHRVVAPMKPLQSILISEFISNSFAKNYLNLFTLFHFWHVCKKNQSSHNVFITWIHRLRITILNSHS